MKKLHFQAQIKIIGVNPYVDVSKPQAQQLKPDWKKPLPVLVQVNGQPKSPWKINLMPKGKGDFYLYLHGDVRKASKTKVGDLVTVDLQFDANYKSGPAPMPIWFKKALENHPDAKENWKKLPPSRQKELVRYLSVLKSASARQDNLQKTLEVLSGRSAHFMGRDWKEGK